MLTVDVPISNPKKPPLLTFPDHCVNCGKPQVRIWTLKLNTGAQKGGQMVPVVLDVPLCADCAAKEDRISNVTWLPFSIVGFLVCVVVFVPVWLFSPQGTTPESYNIPYVLGASVGLMAGIAVGTLVEFGLKWLLAPAYGKLLAKRPLTVFSVLNDTEDLIGISARFTEQKKILKLTFENDTIAREFSVLNPQEKE